MNNTRRNNLVAGMIVTVALVASACSSGGTLQPVTAGSGSRDAQSAPNHTDADTDSDTGSEPADIDAGSGTGSEPADEDTDVDAEPDTTNTDTSAAPVVPPAADLELYTDSFGWFGIDRDQVEVYTEGHFAYWWDARFDSLEEAKAMAAVTAEVHADLAAVGVGTPGASAAGYYTNVFLHRGDDDVFPEFFGNGTGYEGDDENGGPVFAYLAYPYDEDLAANRVNLFHELFHVFQGTTTFNGADVIDGDGPFERAWFVEAMAEWFQMARVGDTEVRAFENVHAITAMPELPLWAFFPRIDTENRSFSDEAAEALDYAAGIRQYSNGAFLYYLSDVVGVDEAALFEAMYLELERTPQEMLFEQLGSDAMRSHYASWAAANTAGFDYVTTEQAELAQATFESFTDTLPSDRVRPFAIEVDGTDAVGTHRPAPGHEPGAWAYNVARISGPIAGSHTFTLDGDAEGSAGTPAHFELRIVVRSTDGSYRHVEATMTDAARGTATVDVRDDDAEVFAVVSSVPESFVGDTETFGYSLSVDRNAPGEVEDAAARADDDDTGDAGTEQVSTGVDDTTLRVFLLAGQSNAGGYGYAYDSAGGFEEQVTSIEYLLRGDEDATTYRAAISDDASYTVLPHLDDSWLEQRSDVWAVGYRSDTGSSQDVRVTPTADEVGGVQPLSPGFGVDDFHAASFGPELGLGHRLGEYLDAPVLIVKSTAGGTSLAEDWRSPNAVEDRGGSEGASFANTADALREMLDELEADLADDGLLNEYDNATDYVVAGLVWVHGWNDHLEESFVEEYEDNVVDLVESIQATHARIPDDLPVVVVESSDRDPSMNAARRASVAELNRRAPGSAVFVETADLLDAGLGPRPDGRRWSDTLGYHFNGKAENYLELGWRAGSAVIDNDFLG